MPNSNNDAQTIEGLDTDDQLLQLTNVGLTIIYHPDSSRVGEVVSLLQIGSGKQCSLSRLEPVFRKPYASGNAEALATEFMSRTPVTVEATRSGVIRLRSEKAGQIQANGVAIDKISEFTYEELGSGITLMFGKGVVLLLHLLDPKVHKPAAKPQSNLGLVGDSLAVRQLRLEILKISNLDVPVLLQGETGVGKELVAQAIVEHSARKNNAYLCVNMAAIPATLAARELFGAEVGAHAEAKSSHAGYFVRAHRGTLFLDEIGDMATEIQPLLLRAVEQGQIQVLGSNRLTNVDVRLIAATDSKLAVAVKEGSFKLPLLQRLAGYEINIPPLRQRRDDIGRLFLYFLKMELARIGESFRLESSTTDKQPWLPAYIMARIAMHNWPGNVRQLRNAARQLAITNRGEATFRVDAALENLLQTVESPEPPPPSVAKTKRKRASSAIDDDTILRALSDNDFVVCNAAAALGVSRSWLFTRMDKCDRIRKAIDIDATEIEACRQQNNNDIDAMAKYLEVSSHGLKQRMKQLGLGR